MNPKAILNVLIVDDEPVIAFTLQKMLLNMDFNRVEMVHNEISAKTFLSSKKVDLAILDINLKNGEEGLALAKICQQKDIPFFYVSSYTDKATLDKAIQTAPGAYVVKPFLQSNLYTAIELTLNSLATKEAEKFFTFKEKGSLVKIKHNDIIYIKADDIYSEIFTTSKAYVYRSSIKKLLVQFSTDQFIKIHRSYAVNLNYITKVNSNSVELEGIELPLSRTFKAELIQRFEEKSS